MHSYQVRLSSTPNYKCLNPCFNGRCTRTKIDVVQEHIKSGVLILVLMEDALVLMGIVTITDLTKMS